MERDAVPARGLVTRTRAASGPARPALRLGREELANRQRRRLKAVSTCRVNAARRRGEASKPRGVPRRRAERRARPQADARGNADHPWRAPYRLAGSDVPIRNAGADHYPAPLGAPPPLFYLGQLSCSGLA